MISFADALKKKAPEKVVKEKKIIPLKKKLTKTNVTNSEGPSLPRKRKSSQMEVDPPTDGKSNESGVASAPVFQEEKRFKLVAYEERKINIPQHRLTPLKNNWMKIYTPIVENLHLNIRFVPKLKQVQIRTSDDTPDASNIQKAADFVQGFVLGFEVDDALALIRLHDLFIETFDVKDVKLSVTGDHMGRAIGRLAGKGGKTRFLLENTTKTRIVIADSRIHILGSYDDIAQARKAICALILGSPPAKVFGNLKAYVSKRNDRM